MLALPKLPKFKFPRISRLIPEVTLKKGVFTLILAISFILSVLIVMQLIDLGRSVSIMRFASAQQEASREELLYWEDVIGRYPGYRDAYFRAYLLSSRLNDKGKAQRYMGELLRIDPSFEIGQ